MGTIEDVKAQLDIVETVRGYVPALKRVGRSWKAPCPFHSERTPSFIVDPDRGTWHCFGACSTGGDVIGFVQRIEHLEFREALQRCAERAGVELRPPSARERQEREVHERLLRANEAAAVYFQAALLGPAGAKALAYAEQRGLDQGARETWQIGYAPDDWRGLTEHLLARGFTEADLREAGLGIDGDRGMYDRFRDRLIYPTRDARGRMIGFGARALSPDQEPKYLNTPQTPLFDKSGSLYGLDRAGEEARRADRMIVVEGYMDVISCHQAGFRNVVASMGTSITEKQIESIKRLTSRIVLVLDSDSAGAAAMIRGNAIAEAVLDKDVSVADIPRLEVKRGYDGRVLSGYVNAAPPYALVRKLVGEIRLAVLPTGEDPDSLVRNNPDLFRQIVEDAPLFIEHIFTLTASDPRLENTTGQSAVAAELAPIVAAVADMATRWHFIHQLSLLTGLSERDVENLVLQSGAPQRPAPVVSRREVEEVRRGPAKRTAPATAPDGEAQLLQLLLLRPEARDVGLGLDGDVFEDTTNRRLFEAWRGVEDLDGHLLDLDDDVAERVSALHASAVGTWDPATLEAKHVAPRVEDIARLLRLRRARARLVPAALAQATAIADARRSAAPETEIEELRTDLAVMDAQQRTLARRASGRADAHEDTTSYSAETVSSGLGAGGNGMEDVDDPDV